MSTLRIWQAKHEWSGLPPAEKNRVGRRRASAWKHGLCSCSLSSVGFPVRSRLTLRLDEEVHYLEQNVRRMEQPVLRVMLEEA